MNHVKKKRQKRNENEREMNGQKFDHPMCTKC